MVPVAMQFLKQSINYFQFCVSTSVSSVSTAAAAPLLPKVCLLINVGHRRKLVGEHRRQNQGTRRSLLLLVLVLLLLVVVVEVEVPLLPVSPVSLVLLFSVLLVSLDQPTSMYVLFPVTWF